MFVQYRFGGTEHFVLCDANKPSQAADIPFDKLTANFDRVVRAAGDIFNVCKGLLAIIVIIL